jgi:hypothetical protein
MNKILAILLCLPIAFGPSCSLLEAGGQVANAEEGLATAEFGKASSDAKLQNLLREKEALERRVETAEAAGESADLLEVQLLEAERQLEAESYRNKNLESDLRYAQGVAAGAKASMQMVSDQVTAGAGLAAGPGGQVLAQAGGTLATAAAIFFGRMKALKSAA